MIYSDDLLARMPDLLQDRLQQEESLKRTMARGLSLRQALLDGRRADELSRSLGVWAIETLKLTLRTFASTPFGFELLERTADREGMPGAGLQAGMAALERCGIVFSFKKMWGEKLYVLPADIGAIWDDRLFPEQSRGQTVNSVKTVSASDRNAAAVLFDLLVFIAKRQPTLTKKGAMAKRHADNLQTWLSLAPESFAELGLRYPHADVYGPETAVMLDFAHRLGLLKDDGSQLEVDQGALSDWLRLDEQAMNRTLLSFWMKLYSPERIEVRRWLASWERSDAAEWITLPLLTDEDGNDSQTSISAAIRPMVELGWVELGETAERLIAARSRIVRTAAGAEEASRPAANGPFYVQPDFEVLVPPDVAYTVRWELEAIAERTRTDQVTVYRIGKETVLNALNDGFSVQGIIEFLRTNAKHGVPDNVREAIEQWGRFHGKVHVETVTLLRCRDAEVAAEIAANPKLAACLGVKLGELDYPVLSGPIENFILVLAEAGYYPAMSAEETVQSKLPPARKQTDQSAAVTAVGAVEPIGFVYTDNPERLYEFAGSEPAEDRLSAALQDIPAMWMKDLRPYHGSTRRQMIEKAISCKAMLRLRNSGEDRLLTPKRIIESGNGWTLQAFERASSVTIGPEQWEEMQLIVPGVHDLYYD